MHVSGETRPTTYVDNDGHSFEYVHLEHADSRGLGIHFSAFFGKWGNARPYRDTFQGYFHRLKMLGSCTDHDWLFLCDSYGAFRNGTYYTGEHGDRFVERGDARDHRLGHRRTRLRPRRHRDDRFVDGGHGRTQVRTHAEPASASS